MSGIHIRLDDHAVHLWADRDKVLETTRTGEDVTAVPMLGNYLILTWLCTGTLRLCPCLGVMVSKLRRDRKSMI